MLLNLLKTDWILALVCAACVFTEMFLVKKWFTSFTQNIKDARARRGANVILGIFTCFVLSAAQLFGFCDVLGVAYSWVWVIVSTGVATFIYWGIEKVFGDAYVNELGKTFSNFISHSELFDGKITKEGVISVANQLLAITNKVDVAEATKEAKAIDEVVKRLDGFLADGKITDAERAETERIIKASGVNLNGNSTYEKYKALINK